MKILCVIIPVYNISKLDDNNFTVDKWYDVIEEDDSGYTFRGDKWRTFQLKRSECFLTVKESRKRKLNKLKYERKSN